MSYSEDKLKPLSEFYFEGRYTISFNRLIYDNEKDAEAMSSLVTKMLSPEEFNDLWGPYDMHGHFVKDGIRVEMCYSDMRDYYWQVKTEKKETEKNVFSWAVLIQKEFLRLSESIDERKSLIVTKNWQFKYTLEFNKYVYDCISDGTLLCETVRALLLPEVFCSFPNSENMSGYFIKDGIKVEMYGIKVELYDKYMMNYYWQANTSDRLEEMIVFEWADYIKNEYPKIKRNFSVSNKVEGKIWSDEMSEVKKNYKPVYGFMDICGRYIVDLDSYNRYIYKDSRDGITFNKIVHDLLCPEKDCWDGEDEILGYFIKDNIKVNTYWEKGVGYSWKVDTEDEEIKKKVLEWAQKVHKEYLKKYMERKKIPLLVIAGPTASGKTALGIALAKEYGGEVVSADSMQIYKGLDIATAKPTAEETEGIPHHLISIADMDAEFSVADYVRLAKEKIADIHARGKLPILVGGTGLYINSLIDNVNFDNADTVGNDGSVRKRLAEEAERLGGEIMHRRLAEIDPETAEAVPTQNVVRIVRALEVYELTGMKFSDYKRANAGRESDYRLCMIGLNYRDREKLYERINKRVGIMAEKGMVEECRAVYENERLGTACQAIGYKELIPYFKGEADLESCLDKIRLGSRRYAKRQLTWFRRDYRINWIYLDDFNNFDEIIEICKKTVAKSEIM